MFQSEDKLRRLFFSSGDRVSIKVFHFSNLPFQEMQWRQLHHRSCRCFHVRDVMCTFNVWNKHVVPAFTRGLSHLRDVLHFCRALLRCYTCVLYLYFWISMPNCLTASFHMAALIACKLIYWHQCFKGLYYNKTARWASWWTSMFKAKAF